MKLCLYFLVLFVTSGSLVADDRINSGIDKPRIICNDIIFSNNKRITIRLSEYEEGKCQLVNYANIIDKWERVIVVYDNKLYEGVSKKIEIYNFSGEKIKTSKAVTGKIFYLVKQKVILIGQISSHYLVKRSYLLNSNGEILKVIQQSGNVYEINKSNDGNIFWMVSNHIKDYKPYSLLKIYDYKGSLLRKSEIYGAKDFSIKYQNTNYVIHIKKPSIPG